MMLELSNPVLDRFLILEYLTLCEILFWRVVIIGLDIDLIRANNRALRRLDFLSDSF